MAKDFRNKTFSKILRGYSPEEVDAYISYLYDEYVKLERREHEAERKLALATQKLDEYNMEKVRLDDTPEVKTAKSEAKKIIKEAEAYAEETKKSAVDEAKRAAECILSEAAQSAADEAAKIIAEARNCADVEKRSASSEADRLKRKAEAIYDEVSSFRNTLFEMYSSHIEAVEKIANEAEDFIDRAEEIYEDSSEKVGEEIESFDEVIAENTAAEPYETVEEMRGDDLYIDLADEEESTEESEGDSSSDDTASSSEADAIRRRQLDKFFGLLNDEDLIETHELGESDENEEIEEIKEIEEIENIEEIEEIENIDEIEEIENIDEIEEIEDSDDEVVYDTGALLRSNRKKLEGAKNSEADDFHSGDGEDVVDIDSVFGGKIGKDLSLTDEFDIVFSGSNSQKNIDEIRRQPIVAAQAPDKSQANTTVIKKIVKKHK